MGDSGNSRMDLVIKFTQQALNPRASGKWRQKQTKDDHRLWGSMFMENKNRQSSPAIVEIRVEADLETGM